MRLHFLSVKAEAHRFLYLFAGYHSGFENIFIYLRQFSTHARLVL